MELTPQQTKFIDTFSALGVQAGMPPSMARVMGYLLVCEPPVQTADTLRAHLRLSAGSISESLSGLYNAGVVRRFRQPGSRRYSYELLPSSFKLAIALRLQATTQFRVAAEDGLQALPGNARLEAMRDTYALLEVEMVKILRKLA